MKLSKDRVTIGETYVVFYCFGCKTLHVVRKHPNFLGSAESPTFVGSSIIIGYPSRDGSAVDDRPPCHFYMVDGILYYFDNYCAHAYRSTAVEMPTKDQWFTDAKPKVIASGKVKVMELASTARNQPRSFRER